MTTDGDWRFEQCLARARATNGADALGELLQRYAHYLTLLARLQLSRRLGRKVEPEDVVQQTFLDATRRFKEFNGESEEEWIRWIRRILRDRIVDLIRRFFQAKKRDVGLEQDIEAELERSSQALDNGLLGNLTSPTLRAQRREWAVLLADALAQLPPDQREVLVGHYLEEPALSFRQIADRLGRTEDSVQKLHVRGLLKLRPLLGSVQ